MTKLWGFTVISLSVQLCWAINLHFPMNAKTVCTIGGKPYTTMPTSLPTYSPSEFSCALRCTSTANCTSYNYNKFSCFINNVEASHPGRICASRFISAAKPLCTKNEHFIALGGVSGKILKCQCGQITASSMDWIQYSEASPTDYHIDICIDKCLNITPCVTYYGATLTLPCRICEVPPCGYSASSDPSRVYCEIF